MRRWLLALTLLTAIPAHAQDAVDLRTVRVHAAPGDVADWSSTVRITRVELSPSRGFTLTFDHPLSESWKFFSNPSVPSDNYQYTVWFVVQTNGELHTSAFVQMWQGRASTGAFAFGSLSADWNRNYAYDQRWGAMAGYQPRVGDAFGVLITAGNARGESNVTSVRERSNLVAFALPAGDVGTFDFGGLPVPPPAPAPAPQPPPVVVIPPTAPSGDLARFEFKLDRCIAEIQASREENKSFFETVRSEWKTLLKYAAPVVGALLAGKAL